MRAGASGVHRSRYGPASRVHPPHPAARCVAPSWPRPLRGPDGACSAGLRSLKDACGAGPHRLKATGGLL